MIMLSKPVLAMSPGYQAMVRGTRELHQLLAAGKDDSPEADAIRDATDGPWAALSETERDRVRKLSEDLYSLVEPPPPLQPMTRQAQAELNDAYEAKQRGDWDRALELLRHWRASIDPALNSYLRGSIWLEAGDAATAALFFEHASRLNPENESYRYLHLTAVDISDPAAGRRLAAEVLRSPDTSSPVVVSRAAEIEFRVAVATSEMQAQSVARRLEPILHKTLERLEGQNGVSRNRSIYVATLSLLGAGYELRGDTQAAVEFYSRGLQLEPHNDALLVARGLLLYGTSPRALTDLEAAIQVGSSLVWPYLVLAHHYLTSGQFEECRRLCERVMIMNGSRAVMSEASEWMAIAQAELGFPAEFVRASFDNAIRLDPGNERAKRNLAAFESANRPVAIWDTRSAGDVRMWGLAERRFAGAA